MLFEKKPPVWEETGAEPGENLKKEGFKAGYKPPAAYFNWFFNGIYVSVRELQEKLTSGLKKMAFKDTVGDADITDVDGAKIKTGYVAPERIRAASQSANGLLAAIDKKKLDGIEAGANNYVHPSTHPASVITPDSTHRFVTDIEKAVYADKYTKNEVDNKFSTLETAIDWKESVATFGDIESMYPDPQDGWTVNVRDTDYTYRWTGTAWVAISANSIPLATQSLDGKMSAADKRKLDGVAAGAEINVQSDWNTTDTASDAFVKNKPTKVSQFTNDSGFVPGNGGDVSNTKITAIDSIATEFPVPAAGDALKAFMGKTKKFAEDFKNLKTGLLTVGMLVNNCVTDNPNLPLSAAQGKVLMDMLTQLNGDKLAVSIFNSHKTSGDHDGRYMQTSYTTGTGVRNTAYVKPNNFEARWHKLGRICHFQFAFELINTTPSEDIVLITGLPEAISLQCVGIPVVAEYSPDDNYYASVGNFGISGTSFRAFYGAWMKKDRYIKGGITYITKA